MVPLGAHIHYYLKWFIPSEHLIETTNKTCAAISPNFWQIPPSLSSLGSSIYAAVLSHFDLSQLLQEAKKKYKEEKKIVHMQKNALIIDQVLGCHLKLKQLRMPCPAVSIVKTLQKKTPLMYIINSTRTAACYISSKCQNKSW